MFVLYVGCVIVLHRIDTESKTEHRHETWYNTAFTHRYTESKIFVVIIVLTYY